MNNINKRPTFDKQRVLHELQHFLPAQEPLVNFIHHNTLHALQHLEFDQALSRAAQIFGYKVYFPLAKFRELFNQGLIAEKILEQTIIKHAGEQQLKTWRYKLLEQDFTPYLDSKIGALRNQWKHHYQVDLDWHIYPLLFRLLCNYLDQGVALWPFPVENKSFLDAIRELEQHTKVSLFKTPRAREMLLDTSLKLEDLLAFLLGNNPDIYEQYLYDQQFAHKGWSGMVSSIERNPKTLLDPREINLEELIQFELLLEIDTLDYLLANQWRPLSQIMEHNLPGIHDDLAQPELFDILALWQKAFEWSYYDQVLFAIQQEKPQSNKPSSKSFQGLFCLDDRECSLRRYLESVAPDCETFGMPGFFNVALYYKASGSNFLSKLAPAPVKPQHLIKELGKIKHPPHNFYFSRFSHNFIFAWLMTLTIGFWFPIKLILNLLRPNAKSAYDSSVYSARRTGKLSITNEDEHTENNLQIGYKEEEMVESVYQLLINVGLNRDFAPIVYVVAHGASSVNNPHYAAYDCGACSGRDGGVNAQVIVTMANNPRVREKLLLRGIKIPETTFFIAALHDTTRDEIIFYAEDQLSPEMHQLHLHYREVFQTSLALNAKERSRRFMSIDSHLSLQKIHQQIIRRSLSIFEPRPELNHATNALCIIGRREMSRRVFLDRRSFLQSFDYASDATGEILTNILKAAVPVCGGINLEYYFSRVDQNNWGAGTKLPHNVMGLFGVANGTDGDLRTGLPSQMIEIHDPIRMLFLIEHYPDTVLSSISADANIYQWFINNWINLAVIHPETRELYVFKAGKFSAYTPLTQTISTINNIDNLLEDNIENLPVCLI